ncbi:DNA-binding transcriptional LysR family regulator [Anaerospora hongkongensis]|uniref:DNA-binding transcriptional LysR family regulator n=1 Tax=Anaerospora hongkongensis TaxID=244830 RepID=A0A4R1PQI7_9FIRM|nr:LysR family transcriptional regulator [Anaerospora hongkongensis]TCL32742.1 DNA-binding transcriptional LysR family regulator [Anaerospora hongkongensis]
MMSIREMQYFLTVAQEGSITTAAQRLNIAQPPLSRQMKQLEESLGTRLFVRGNRKIQLTEAGCLLQSRAEQLLKLLDNTEKEIKAIETGTHGILSIGTASSSGITILPAVARIFHTQYPNINFELWEGESVRIIELLNGGLIEIGLVRFSFDTDTYESIQLPKEPLVAAIHRNRLQQLDNAKEDCLSLAQLADMPLMIHRKYEAMITAHCQQANFNPHYLCKSDDVMPVLAWADADVGVAVVPRAAMGLIPSPNLVFKTIVDPVIEISSALIWVRNRYLSAAARHFLTLFTNLSQSSQPSR